MKQSLLAWGKSMHYPFLCLADGTHIKHGELPWRRASKSRRQTRLAWARIAQWEARISGERSAS